MCNSNHSKGVQSFSLEHLVFSSVPGKINQRIYEALLKQGGHSSTWVVHADLADLTVLHPGDEAYTITCLERLRSLKLIIRICKTKSGWFFLIPALKDFVVEPIEKTRRGKTGLVKSKSRKRIV